MSLLPWMTLLRAGAASGIMYLAVATVFPGHGLFTVAVRALLGACVYAGLLLLIDPDAQTIARTALDRIRRR